MDSAETQRRLISRTAIDYALYFPSLAASGLMGLISVAVLSRIFAPATYGNYTLALSTMLLLSMITSLWLRSSVMRLLPQYSAAGQANLFVGTLVVAGSLLTVVVTALYVLILVLLGAALDSELYHLLWLATLGIPALTAFTVLTAVHRIQQRSVLYSVLNLLRVIGGFAVGLLLAINLDLGPPGMLLGLILVAGGVTIAHVVPARRQIAEFVPHIRLAAPILRDMLAYTLPIVGVNIASTILAVSDRYLIEGYLGGYALGIYAVSYGVAEGGMRLIANTFLTASEPTIFRTWAAYDSETTFRLIERLFRFYVILALPALVGLSVLRHDIVRLFSTPEYVVGADVVLFVGIALFLHGYSLLVGTVFDATKRTIIPLYTFIAAGALNLVLNIMLLPQYGIQAAAWSTCLAYAALLGLNIFASRRIVRFRLLDPYLWRIAAASAGMGLVTLVARQWLGSSLQGIVTAVCLAVLVYALFVVGVGGVTSGERRAALAFAGTLAARGCERFVGNGVRARAR